MKKIIKVITLSIMLASLPLASATANENINTKANKSSCKNIKKNYQIDIMLSWSNQLSSNKEVIKEIDNNIKMLKIKQKNTSGKIKIAIDNWIKTEENTKKSIEKKDIQGITDAMNLKINSITKFNALCKKIGS